MRGMEWQGELVMKKSRKQWVDQFRETIEDIEGEHFSSHDFIGKFCYRFELEWKQLLAQYDTNANQKVNAYIARLLSLYESDLPIIKESKPMKSKNIHASFSRIHWWKKTTVLLFLLFTWTANLHADDKLLVNWPNTFLQQIAGWEWVCLEEPHEKTIKTPYLDVSYLEYESHPEYRFVKNDVDRYTRLPTNMKVYDTEGNLIRVFSECQGEYDINCLEQVGRMISYSEMANIANDITFKLKNVLDIDSCHIVRVVKEHNPNSLGDINRYDTLDYDPSIHSAYVTAYGKKIKVKKNDLTKLYNQNIAPNTNHIKVDLKRDNRLIVCEFDSIMRDSIYRKCLFKALPAGYIHHGRDEILSLFSENDIDSLCKKQMIVDYLNNKYDVKTNESAETCILIETKLGLRPEPEPLHKKELDRIKKEIMIIALNTMGLPEDEKYLNISSTEDLFVEIKRLHPNWSNAEIRARWIASFNESAKHFYATVPDLVMEDVITNYSDNDISAANHYLNFLKNEYKFHVKGIERLDDTTFQASIEIAPSNTIHNIIINYSQTGPYKCRRIIRIIK